LTTKEWWEKNKNNILVYLLIATTMLITGPIKRFFTIYQRDLGLSLAFVGIIASAGAIFDMIGRFSAGVLSDRKGRKKPLLWLIIGSIAYPFLLIHFTSTTSLLIIEILQSLVNAGFWTIIIAYLYDTNPQGMGGRVYAHALMANFVINLISPLIGGAIIENYGYKWLFSFSCYLGVIPLIILFFLKKPHVRRQALTIKGEISDIIGKPRFIKIWITMIIISFSASFISNFFPIYLKEEIGLSYTQVGLFFSAGTIILLGAQPIIGWIADRFKSRIIIPAGLIILGASHFGIAAAQHLTTLFIARAITPIGIFTSRVKGAAVIAKMTPNEEHALAHALFKSSSGIGWSIMNAIAPLLITAIGYTGVFKALGTMSIITALGYVLTYRKTWREEEKESLKEHLKEHHAFHFTDSNLMEHYHPLKRKNINTSKE